MWAPSRRAFLASSSLALGGLSTGFARPSIALPRNARQPVFTFGPEYVAPDVLRALAQSGIDAARSAGATYADIRVSDLRTLDMRQGHLPKPGSDLGITLSYGVRVQVDGAWAFAYGTHLTTDNVTQSARLAVATARGLAKVASPRQEMVPAPVVHGEWRTPIEIDPFTVSPDEHARVIGAFWDASRRMFDSSLSECTVQWDADTRVFASSEGSLVTQHLIRVDPQIAVDAPQDLVRSVSIPVPGFVPRSAGFECLLGPELQQQIKNAVDESAKLARLPVGWAEVGRRPAVLDGSTVGAFVSRTLAPALMLSRALGHEADESGTSFLSPVREVIGKPLFSPLLNLSADRAMPQFGAARWDDEGVEPEAYSVIEQGQVVDYFATRVTKPALAEWYSKRGVPLRSYGSATAVTAASKPQGTASHLAMRANPTNVSLDDLVSGLRDGILARGAHAMPGTGGVIATSPYASGLFLPVMLYEVKKGRVTRRLRGGYGLFSSPKLWNGLTALGGIDTVEHFTRSSWSRSANDPLLTVAAPAAQVSQLDVILLPRG